MKINFKLNGKFMEVEAKPNWTLLDVIRDQLYLTGTKRGCEAGECGACTVMVNGENVNSCLILIGSVEGKEIITIEGLRKNDELDDIQKVFLEKGALQCGYCTPGMIMSAKALLNKNSSPTREEIQESISGNLCRCTGYEEIIEAIKASAKEFKNDK